MTLLVEQLVRIHGGHQISMTERIANREVFDLFKEVMINQSLEVWSFAHRKENWNSNFLASHADGNPMGLSESWSARCNTITKRSGERRHNQWCGMNKKDPIGCHVTPKIKTG